MVYLAGGASASGFAASARNGAHNGATDPFFALCDGGPFFTKGKTKSLPYAPAICGKRVSTHQVQNSFEHLCLLLGLRAGPRQSGETMARRGTLAHPPLSGVRSPFSVCEFGITPVEAVLFSVAVQLPLN